MNKHQYYTVVATIQHRIRVWATDGSHAGQKAERVLQDSIASDLLEHADSIHFVPKVDSDQQHRTKEIKP